MKQIWRKRKRFPSVNKAICYIILALCITIIVIIAFTLGTYSIIHSEREKEESDDDTDELFLAISLSTSIERKIDEAYFVAQELKGLVIGQVDLSVSSDKPVPNFDFVSRKMSDRYQESVVLYLAPGAHITQHYPHDMNLKFEVFDIFDKDVFPPYFVAGESQDSLRFSNCTGSWNLFQLSGVYDGADSDSRLWGYVGTFINLHNLTIIANVTNETEENNMDYLLSVQDENGFVHVINGSSRFNGNVSQEQLSEFISSGQSSVIEKNHMTFLLTLESREKYWKISNKVFTIIICLEVIIPLICFFLLLGIFLWVHRLYNGFLYAPRYPPFAIIKIGPQNAEELWSLSSDEMNHTIKELNLILEAHMKKFHAYQIPQVQPYTTTYVLRSVDDAVQMAFDVMKDALQQKIDADLVRLLGEDAHLMMVCSIHWCTDASITVNASNETVDYRGVDVVYGSKLWSASPPHSISLSKSARNELLQSSFDYAIQYGGSVIVSGFDDTQDIFVVSFPGVTMSDCNEMSVEMVGAYPYDNERIQYQNVQALQSSFASSDLLFRSTADPFNSSHGDSGSFDSLSFETLPIGCREDKTSYPVTLSSKKKELASCGRESTPKLEITNTASQRQLCFRRSKTPHHPLLPLSESGFSHFSSPLGEAPLEDVTRTGWDSGAFGTILQSHNPTAILENPLSCHTDSDMRMRDNRNCLEYYNLPLHVERRMQVIFEMNPAVAEINFHTVKKLFFIFYTSQHFLFLPLTKQELENITLCLAAAFGVSGENIQEYLSVHCAIRFIQQHTEMVDALWECDG